MNTYLVGIGITILIYIIAGAFISKGVKNADDYYVAGRNAPTLLITGSLVASFIGVGLFMGDVGESYSGFFAPIMVAVGILSVGYVVGSVFFGRYLRRSGVSTIAQFFGKRFDSKPLQILATATGAFIMLVYSLSCVQGMGTLMSAVTGLSYNLCVIISCLSFTLITLFSGAKGVLITDTIMFGIFSVASIIGAIFIAKSSGGWVSTVMEMAQYDAIPGILSWSGNLDYFYGTGLENMIWAIGYGIAWMSVLMVAPWQSSRYLMAKDEHTVIKSGIIASAAVFTIEFLMCMAGVFCNKLNPGMEDPSQALIWAAMNVMPKILGIVVLSGVLAAGISSATTFLSLIGSNIANDIFKIEDDKKRLHAGRISVIVIGLIICILCLINPPQIFWITYLGATIVSCSWLPVAIASVWSKKVTKTGAFWGMLIGFTVSSVYKIYTAASGVSVPIWFDPFFVGMFAGLAALIIGSALTKPTENEIRERKLLMVMPESEKNAKEMKKTQKAVTLMVPMGVIVTVVLLFLWALPMNK